VIEGGTGASSHMEKFRGRIRDPNYWGERSVELRAHAATTTDRKGKAVLSGTAAGYDKVAQSAEADAEKRIEAGDGGGDH
jgi:hypothetical protein